MYIITARRITSGELLKYRKGLCIARGYGTPFPGSSRFTLTLPAQAHQYHAMVMRNGGNTMAELAAEAGVGGSYFTRILRLSFLAPDIVKAILRDRHPIELTAKRLANEVRLPLAWQDQHALLGTD